MKKQTFANIVANGVVLALTPLFVAFDVVSKIFETIGSILRL